jgi:serine/threonine protein phosphatase PrpC
MDGAAMVTCPACHSPTPPGARYCEACGHEVDPEAAAEPGASASGDATPLDSVRVPTPASPCAACGGVVADDGYCQTCGTPAVRVRDHFGEQPAPWVAGVCDRGLRHHRNEDAMALAADQPASSRAVLVVCDGVSSSTDSDRASLAAARAAREVLTGSRPQGAGTTPARVAATVGLLTSAVEDANAAVVAATDDLHGHSPASCTIVGAVLDRELLVVGWVGDSRAYWLPDDGPATALTVDDSWAAAQIAHGVPRPVAESGPQAHAITRWLGVDSTDHAPRTVSAQLSGPGWVLLCSDGLWNYCSEAEDLAALVREQAAAAPAAPGPEPDPMRLAEALVAWANEQGGHDNITVALARVGP